MKNRKQLEIQRMEQAREKLKREVQERRNELQQDQKLSMRLQEVQKEQQQDKQALDEINQSHNKLQG